MAGSTFGEAFRVTTWGESHGPAIGCVIDGCPAGLAVSEEDIQRYLDRRKPGTSAVTTARKEADQVEILSGIFEGRTTGTPISLMIRNTSQHSKDYSNLAHTYRPGHADLGFDAKYGHRDYRGGGRSSGRETAARVAAGAVAMKFLEQQGIRIDAYTIAIGDVALPDEIRSNITEEGLAQRLQNTVGMPDAAWAGKAEALIADCRSRKDSVGGAVECLIRGVPAGVGEPVFDKLDALLGQALFSIGAVKAVEIGDGIKAANSCGSGNNDPMFMDGNKIGFASNHAGGILGGMSNGADILARAYFKPTPSIYQTQETVTAHGENTSLTIVGRHDPCVVPRALVVVECMCGLTVADLLLRDRCSRM